MNIIYTWAIISMEMAPSLDGLSDVVTLVRFKYTGTDSISGYSGDFDGSTPVGTPDPNNFVPLQDLTEEEVIAWVKYVYNFAHPSEVVLRKINNQIAPTNEDAPMPWAPPEPLPPVPPTE